jgi:nitrate/nitrite-specific signal transduction histidine kinase
VELELEYHAEGLNVSIRDNGCGIDPVVLQSGRDGHWGLSGMRERAERIGAKLKLWSRVQGGTEVALSIPSRIAFESNGSGGASNWFARLYGFKGAGVTRVRKGSEIDG